MISIPFVGKMRSQILEDNGFTLGIIKNCDTGDIAKLDGFSMKIAERIQKYARMVDKNYIVPKETIFNEFRCPQCGAIVSEVEYRCHKCGHRFFLPPAGYEEKMDALAEAIVRIYKEPANPQLWRRGANILEEMDNEKRASDFKFKASTMELEIIDREEGEETVEIPVEPEHRKLGEMYKKGMINGLVNGSGPYKTRVEGVRRAPTLILSLIIVIPVVMVALLTYGTAPPIAIDGKFGDWNGIPSLNVVSSYFTDFKIKNYDGYDYIYIASHGFFVNSTHQYFALLVDGDGNGNTGYPVNQLGVDYILLLYGGRGNITKNFIRFDNGSWLKTGDFDVGMNSKHLEMRTMNFGNDARFLLYYMDGVEHYSSIITLKSVLTVRYGGGMLVTSGGVEIESVDMWNAFRGKIKIGSMSIENVGNSSAQIEVKCGDYDKSFNVGIGNKTLNLDEPIMVDGKTSMHIIYLSGGERYGTLKFRIHTSYPQINIDRCNGAYIGAIPDKKSVDGIFLDWKDARKDARGKLPGNIDLKSQGFSNEGRIYVYLSVYGMLYGVGVPEIRVSGGNASGGNATHVRNLPEDTVEIYVDEDRNSGTGFKIGGIGAEYRILLSGKNGFVDVKKFYRWEGKWVNFSMGMEYAKDYDSMEIALNLRGDVYFRLVNFRGLYDRLSSIKSFKSTEIGKNTENSTPENPAKSTERQIKPVFEGKYNASDMRTIFGTDVRITNASYDESRPTITRTSDGTLWVTYDYAYSASDHDVYFANSTDDGATWSVYSLDATTYNTPNSVIISDPSDDVYIFPENHTSGAYFKYWEHHPTDGNTWYIYSNSSWNWWNSIYNISAAAYTTGGNIYVYVIFEYAYSSTDYDVGYVKTTNGGALWWDYHDDLALTTYWEGHPDVTISTGTNPEVFVGFENYSSTNKWCVTVLNNTNINGTTWWGHYFRSAYGKNLTNPSISASGDYVYMAAEDEWKSTDHDIVLYNSTDNGLNWGGHWVSTTTDDELYPSVVANDLANLNVYVFYLNKTSGYIIEMESSDGGYSWSNPSKVSDVGKGVALYRTVSSCYSGKLYVVWTDSRNGNDDIYFDKVPEMNGALMIPAILLIPILWRKRNKY